MLTKIGYNQFIFSIIKSNVNESGDSNDLHSQNTMDDRLHKTLAIKKMGDLTKITIWAHKSKN